MRWPASFAIAAILALAASESAVATGSGCPASPIDGAACPTKGLVCRYPKRGFLCECEPKRQVWRCGELGE